MKGKWTQEEIDTLTRMYPNHYAREIADILGRGISSIHFSKAKRYETG